MTLVSFPVLERVFAVERAASHPPAKCKFKEHKCHQCGKVGHIKLVCHSRPVDKADQPSKDGEMSIVYKMIWTLNQQIVYIIQLDCKQTFSSFPSDHMC